MNRLTKYNDNLALLYPILKDGHVSRLRKLVIYSKSILTPILIYGLETWSLTSKIKSKIQAVEMKVLRMIKGVTRRDRIKNLDIKQN